VTKGSHLQNAVKIFAGSGVNITPNGRPYLGAALGSPDFIEEHLRSKVEEWTLNITFLSATAATASLLNMHSHATKEVFPLSGTMKSVILQPISSHKCVVRCALNLICSQLCHINCLEPLPIHRTGRGLMSQQMECGVGDLKRHFLMCMSSTSMPPPTRTRHLQLVTESMSKRKKRAHEQMVEHSSFTPLVFSVTGGMGREATCFYKQLASMLA